MSPRRPPPPLHTGVPGSFAQDTLRRRIPALLAESRRHLPRTPPAAERDLDELATELATGVVRGLREQTPDRPFWDGAAAPHLGHGWLDLPWYFAETFFYRRLLEATGYFGEGPLAGIDPFASHKEREWQPAEGPRRLSEALAAAPDAAAARLRVLLYASLWGNRADLSYNVAEQLGAYAGDASTDLVVDHSDQLLAFLDRRRRARLVVVADNAGTELLMDLALVDHLLSIGAFATIDLHLKTHPIFVSDAMPSDVDRARSALDASGLPHTAPLAARIAGLRAEGRLVLKAHPFYTTSLFYPELPPDLAADFAAADLVLLKGDASYRRLCSDAPWDPATPFEEVVWYFPGNLITLRTLKSEVAVGLPPGAAERLTAEDPRWMVNGRRALIQSRLAG